MSAPGSVDRDTICRALESGALADVFVGGGGAQLTPSGLDRLARLAESIATAGYDPEFPILVNQWGEIVDGHHRAAVCRLLGVEPVRRFVRRRHRQYCCYPCTCGEGRAR